LKPSCGVSYGKASCLRKIVKDFEQEFRLVLAISSRLTC